MLWPDVLPRRGIHRLHVAISGLRKLIDALQARDSAVLLQDDCYSVVANAVVTDCELFEGHYLRAKFCLGQSDAAGAATAFLEALALYRGDYLADRPYQEWTHQQRAHFVERRLNALTFLCENAVEERDLSAVVDYAQQILAVDSLRERAHRHLMRAHYMMGQRGCALRQYNACALALQHELGAQPSQQTQWLHKAIRDDAQIPAEPPI